MGDEEKATSYMFRLAVVYAINNPHRKGISVII